MPPAPGSTLSRENEALLARHGLTVVGFEATGLDWTLLDSIREDHARASGELEQAMEYIAGRLRPVPAVHSLKMRVKNPEHLVVKIVRKKAERPELDFRVDSYHEHITDLIGIRALHLFKDEWRAIHEFVRATWETAEPPTAYFRNGDPPELIESFRSAGCETKEHPFGYRSVHYLIRSQPARRVQIAELQVRTIFEEGWSEIDHRVRYPRLSQDPYLGGFLTIFNRLAGSADEMGTFTKALSGFLREQSEVAAAREKALNDAVSKLKIGDKEKAALEAQIAQLKESVDAVPSADKAWLEPWTSAAGRLSFVAAVTGVPSIPVPRLGVSQVRVSSVSVPRPEVPQVRLSSVSVPRPEVPQVRLSNIFVPGPEVAKPQVPSTSILTGSLSSTAAERKNPGVETVEVPAAPAEGPRLKPPAGSRKRLRRRRS